MVIADETTDWLGRVGGAPLPVLLTLYSGGQMHQAQIARATRLKPQTVREALHVLEIRELVVAFYGDRWAITPRGDALVARMRRRREL